MFIRVVADKQEGTISPGMTSTKSSPDVQVVKEAPTIERTGREPGTQAKSEQFHSKAAEKSTGWFDFAKL